MMLFVLALRRSPLTAVLVVTMLQVGASGSEPPAVERYLAAMGQEDYVEKKEAIATLVAAPLDDAIVLPLLVAAVADRQAHELAVPALRARTGLRPATSQGGNTGYPGYPADDSAWAWRIWLTAWREERAESLTLQRQRLEIERNQRRIEQLQAQEQTTQSTLPPASKDRESSSHR